MNILYIQKQDLNATGKKILETHRKQHKVTVVNLREDKDYGKIVDMIFASDKVISW